MLKSSWVTVLWLGAIVAVAPAGTLFEAGPVTAPQNPVDAAVFGQLRKLNLAPANLCSDAVFVRRVYLDVIGTLPTADEAKSFLNDSRLDKRAALIERLLVREEFADYWALKWSDLLRIKAEFPINLWPNAAQAYHRWVRTSIRDHWPYDRFVRELLTASGSNFRVPPANFYRALQSREPAAIAQTVALTFMGTRAENWPKDRLAGMAMFFSQIGYKSTAEWKEEIVFHDSGKATGAVARVAVFPDGKAAPLPPDQDPRVVFAHWLVSPHNPWFTRNIVNRVWSWLLGRGIIHEPDDIRPDNPPVNPELLAVLERELIAAQYDLHHLYRLILNSQTYQLSCIPASSDPKAEAHFAVYPLRWLEAEVLIDALNQITGTTENYSSAIPEPFTYIPEEQRAIALADGSVTSPFLELFGRSPRDTGLEMERPRKPSAAQRLHLLNSSHIRRKLEQGPKMRALTQSRGNTTDQINHLYLTILSRFPTAEERNTVQAYLGSTGSERRGTLTDVAWALVNSPEFLYRH